MIQANCPNCGDSVPFKSEFSTHAVCASCDSLIVRQGASVENLGKVAEIQQDGSPLQLGTTGHYIGKTFQIIGRIQLRYGDGFWNEWYLLYSSGETGWLGEAMGEYFLSFQADAGAALPRQHQLGLGDKIGLGNESFVVTGVTENQLAAYEGEIPFLVDSEQTFKTFDLRSVSGKAATIDFSDDPPSLFIGEYKRFEEIKFSGLRQEGQPPEPGSGIRVPAATAGLEKFNCPTCGAPHSVQGGVRSKVLVCQYCDSAVDISNSSLNVIWREQKMRQKLQQGTDIPLGSVANFGGDEYKAIGYVKKSVTYEGINYPWVEYLLYNRTNGYRWLVESDGHYTLMETLPKVPSYHGAGPVGKPNPVAVEYEGQSFRHFQPSTAVVEAVAGEFYWRVKVGEAAINYDFVAPPKMLSMEASQTSYVWAAGLYLEPQEVRNLFGLERPLKPPVGVAPAQPNPYQDSMKSMWRVFSMSCVAALVLLFTGLISGPNAKVFDTGGQSFETFRTNPPKTSEKFELKGHGNVAFEFQGRPSQRWLFLEAELVNQESKKAYKAGATLERFHGKGDWSKTVRISGVPAGSYVLRWSGKSGTTSTVADTVDAKKQPEKVSYSIKVYRGVRVWGWFLLLVIALLPLPLWVTAKRAGFETRRWYNSDYG